MLPRKHVMDSHVSRLKQSGQQRELYARNQPVRAKVQMDQAPYRSIRAPDFGKESMAAQRYTLAAGSTPARSSAGNRVERQV